MKGEAEVAGKPQRPERAFWEVWARPQATCLVNAVTGDTGAPDLRMAELSTCGRFLPDMFILKLAIATCTIYMGITLLLLLGGCVVVYWKGMIGYTYNFHVDLRCQVKTNHKTHSAPGRSGAERKFIH